MQGGEQMSNANFSIGQLIHHRLFDYRGVIVDVDPEYAGSQEWYEHVAKTRPPKNRPWYHILVDGSDVETYVAEQNLEEDQEHAPIEHPMVGNYFADFSGEVYEPNWRVN